LKGCHYDDLLLTGSDTGSEVSYGALYAGNRSDTQVHPSGVLLGAILT
jgi:hypothetical protein